MLRKLFALGAGLAVAGTLAINPAEATTTAATVQGNMDLQLDVQCDVTGDNVPDAGTYTADFLGVNINGTFATDGGPAYVGNVFTPGISACILVDTAVGPVPVISGGKITGGDYGTPGDAAGIATDGGLACLDGRITGGTFATTGLVAEAIFDLEWDIFRPVGATCNSGALQTLGSGSSSATANVGAVPLGNAIQGLPSTVTGVVHGT